MSEYRNIPTFASNSKAGGDRLYGANAKGETITILAYHGHFARPQEHSAILKDSKADARLCATRNSQFNENSLFAGSRYSNYSNIRHVLSNIGSYRRRWLRSSVDRSIAT